MSEAARTTRIRRVLLVALTVNATLAALKFGIGWKLGSLGVLSDAVHSLLDGAASVIALIGITAAARPPTPATPTATANLKSSRPLSWPVYSFSVPGKFWEPQCIG